MNFFEDYDVFFLNLFSATPALISSPTFAIKQNYTVYTLAASGRACATVRMDAGLVRITSRLEYNLTAEYLQFWCGYWPIRGTAQYMPLANNIL
jgi:hypothetical protein